MHNMQGERLQSSDNISVNGFSPLCILFLWLPLSVVTQGWSETPLIPLSLHSAFCLWDYYYSSHTQSLLHASDLFFAVIPFYSVFIFCITFSLLLFPQVVVLALSPILHLCSTSVLLMQSRLLFDMQVEPKGFIKLTFI